MSDTRRFLGGLSARQFLTGYWQKRPLLVRDALPGYQSPISAEELLGLACEDEVEARRVDLVDGRYVLHDGPFEEQTLASLGERDWTVLVSDLDEHIPELAPLLDELDFLPSWRIDDIMASFAVPGGSVGPHFDSYDVFLLQVAGHRRWQVSTQYDSSELMADSQLRLLSRFEPEEEWVLGPGDMLYLPPQVAHFGVAQDACVTFSLGCRAPSDRELLAQLTSDLLDRADEERRIADSDLLPLRRRFRLSRRAIDRACSRSAQLLRLDDDLVARSFAKLVTRPKALFTNDWVEPLDDTELDATLSEPVVLERRKGGRWLYLRRDAQFFLYVDGNEYAAGSDETVIERLCAARLFSSDEVSRWKQNEVLEALLRDLVRWGHLNALRESNH